MVTCVTVTRFLTKCFFTYAADVQGPVTLETIFLIINMCGKCFHTVINWSMVHCSVLSIHPATHSKVVSALQMGTVTLPYQQKQDNSAIFLSVGHLYNRTILSKYFCWSSQLSCRCLWVLRSLEKQNKIFYWKKPGEVLFNRRLRYSVSPIGLSANLKMFSLWQPNFQVICRGFD